MVSLILARRRLNYEEFLVEGHKEKTKKISRKRIQGNFLRNEAWLPRNSFKFTVIYQPRNML